MFLNKTFNLGSAWNSQFSLLLNLGGFEWQGTIVKEHQVSGAVWIHLYIKTLSRKKQEFSIYSEIRSFTSCLESNRSLDGGVCEKSLVYIILTVVGSLVLVWFYACFMLAELCCTKSGKRYLQYVQGFGSSWTFLYWPKDQGEEEKRICSCRETSLVPVPAFLFSVLPPVNKTGTRGTAPEVLWLFIKCSGIFIRPKQNEHG